MEERISTTAKKLLLILLALSVACMVTFSTWQLFRGNLEAAFSTLPFLLVVYLFLLRRK